ncbi:MAG: hypothetical protein A2W35_06780 [Chloroflexi bacterium RBG_16_57_11]|nr:MAG: hypothetical protein A2W35_06780 [Chloroflexi bacterium RBG_16_57_11]
MPDQEPHTAPEQAETLAALTSPARIQAYLDTLQYPSGPENRCPWRVMAEDQAHCLDGALFAAFALRRLGHPPIIVDLLPEPGADDDHVLAIYRHGRGFGALAKSNFTGLRLREPVYRSLRELVMSYFDFYFNVDGVKTLRFYTPQVRLEQLDPLGWMTSDAGVDAVEVHLSTLCKIPLLAPEMIAALTAADPLTYRAGTLVVNPAGLYKPQAT